ncbi:helix-turn-helix domain-containing protein [Celeribacter sp.]|uniref:helix-turn-helix domain-containing protein n=1 Tax=Celeribacter sp. TaxID=1890673 RepID=UPI003A8DB0F4
MEIDKDIQLKKLGMRIRKLRLDKNLTQFDLGILVNKDQQSIQRLEVGKMNPTYIYLMEICNGLEISLSELFDI